MTWEAAGAVAVMALSIAVIAAGFAWTLGRIFRPWMREASREACEALYDRLQGNDFRHVEEAVKVLGGRLGGLVERLNMRVDRLDERLDGLGARIDERLDRAEAQRREEALAMEARIVEAVLGRHRPAPARSEPDSEVRWQRDRDGVGGVGRVHPRQVW